MTQPDIRAIACNTAVSAPGYRAGALAFVARVSHDRARVLVRSRGSRWLELWLPITNLRNFRFRTIPSEHPLYGRIGPVGDPEFLGDKNLAALRAADDAKRVSDSSDASGAKENSNDNRDERTKP